MNDREREEKLLAYQNMLKTGQIDETTYNNMVERNIGVDFAKSYKPRKNKKPLIVVVLVCLLIFGLFKLFKANANPVVVEKEYEYVNDFDDINPPIQNNYKGATTMMVDNVFIDVDYVAYYEVSGRVVAKVSYMANNVENMLAPNDVALVWGKLATNEYMNKFTFDAHGDRFVYWKTTDMEWYRNHTSDKEVTRMHSNNHLVTNDKELLAEINSIKKGDYVKIKGYLVNMYWLENNSNHTWKSSVSRDDIGDGACEVIYVTDVKWLKEA